MSHNVEDAVSGEIRRLLSTDLSYNNVSNSLHGFILNLSRQQNLPPIQIIDQAIQYQRQLSTGAENQALDFLTLYRVTWVRRRRKGTSRQIQEASAGKVKLDAVTLNEVVLMQNRARGKTFENMGSILVEYYLRQIEKYSGPLTISVDQMIFESLDSKGRDTKRRFDLYLTELGIGVEIKSGRITYQSSIKDQIHKDHYLLTKKIVRDVWWFLFYGASQRVLTELLQRNINFIDLGFNDYDDN